MSRTHLPRIKVNNLKKSFAGQQTVKNDKELDTTILLEANIINVYIIVNEHTCYDLHMRVSVFAWKHSMASPHCRRNALCGCWVLGTGSWGMRYSTPWSPHLRNQTCARLSSWHDCWIKGNLRRQNGETLVNFDQLCYKWESCFSQLTSMLLQNHYFHCIA